MTQTILRGKYDIGSFSFDGELVITLRAVLHAADDGGDFVSTTILNANSFAKLVGR